MAAPLATCSKQLVGAALTLVLTALTCATWAQDIHPEEASASTRSPLPRSDKADKTGIAPADGERTGAEARPASTDPGSAPGGTALIIRPVAAVKAPEQEGFQWRSAFSQSLEFLAIQHGFRLAKEQGTRNGLKGPFFRDWMDSIKGVRGWRDGDPFYVNYVGHPMQGAITGLLQVQNDPRGRNLEFNDPGYWRSRSKAMLFSAAYSAQFELGPISEASIGNVGKDLQANGYTGAGAVDLVVTPTVGTMMLIGEDWVDRFAIRRLEDRTSNRFLKAMIRIWLNPNRSMANVLRGEYPWHRDTRPGISVTLSGPELPRP